MPGFVKSSFFQGCIPKERACQRVDCQKRRVPDQNSRTGEKKEAIFQVMEIEHEMQNHRACITSLFDEAAKHECLKYVTKFPSSAHEQGASGYL